MLLAYCAGLIAVCTGLLIIATSFIVQIYWMLRRLADAPPGKHEGAPAEPARSAVTYYDSGPPAADDVEWTGPVVAYTPPRR